MHSWRHADLNAGRIAHEIKPSPVVRSVSSLTFPCVFYPDTPDSTAQIRQATLSFAPSPIILYPPFRPSKRNGNAARRAPRERNRGAWCGYSTGTTPVQAAIERERLKLLKTLDDFQSRLEIEKVVFSSLFFSPLNATAHRARRLRDWSEKRRH